MGEWCISLLFCSIFRITLISPKGTVQLLVKTSEQILRAFQRELFEICCCLFLWTLLLFPSDFASNFYPLISFDFVSFYIFQFVFFSYIPPSQPYILSSPTLTLLDIVSAHAPLSRVLLSFVHFFSLLSLHLCFPILLFLLAVLPLLFKNCIVTVMFQYLNCSS